METTTLLSPDNAKSFFPLDLAERLGIDPQQMGYFGLHTRTEERYRGQEVVRQNYYVMALLWDIAASAHPDLSFAGSHRWIAQEDRPYRDLCEGPYSDQTRGHYPLLLLRIDNWCQPKEHPFRFAELYRYADHERFRRRGVATATLESLSTRMNAEGTEYIFLNANWSFWPAGVSPVPASYIGKRTQGEIVACLPSEYSHYEDGNGGFTENFSRWLNGGFFRFTDADRNTTERVQALARQQQRSRSRKEKQIHKTR